MAGRRPSRAHPDQFAYAPPSSWALRVDSQLRITLETGTVTAYAPTLANQTYTLTNTSVLPSSGVYTTFTSTREAFTATAATATIGGPYQSNP